MQLALPRAIWVQSLELASHDGRVNTKFYVPVAILAREDGRGQGAGFGRAQSMANYILRWTAIGGVFFGRADGLSIGPLDLSQKTQFVHEIFFTSRAFESRGLSGSGSRILSSGW